MNGGAAGEGMKRPIAMAVGVVMFLFACSAPRGEEGAPAPTRPSVTSEGERPSGRQVAANPFGLKWNWEQAETLASYLDRTAGGATFFLVSWCEVEREQGQRDWREVDRVAAGARQLGYELYLKVRVGSCWATGGAAGAGTGRRNRTPSLMPTRLDAYLDFVGEAVTRYSPMGVHAWGVENEVNALNFWRGTPEEYTRLARDVAGKIRSVDRQARVFDSGLSSIAYGGLLARRLIDEGKPEEALRSYQRYYARRFANAQFVYPRANSVEDLNRALSSDVAHRAQRFLDATIALYRDRIVDGFQLHYYDPWTELPAVLDYLRDRLGPDSLIEAWEVGVAWPGPDYDASEHAAEVVKLFSTLLGAGVRRAIYLPVAFTPGGQRADELVRGLVEPDGTVRPAGDAYVELLSVAKGETSRTRISAGRFRGLAFSAGPRTTLVLWAEGEATLPETLAADVRDLRGRPLQPKSGVAVTGMPVVVSGEWPVQDALAALASAPG